jgi:TetR/AcrR family transcriptional regulator, repressor for uid operon
MTVTAPETRDRLLEAALVVFERDGYDGARVADIAREAGLTTGAIYSQYRGKAALLFDAISTRTREEVDHLLEVASGEEARSVLAALGRRVATHPDTNGPSLLVEAIGAARRDPDLSSHVLATLERRERALIDLVERAKAVGDVAADLDAHAVARFCLAIALGSLTIRSVGLAPIDPDQWTHLLTRLLYAVAPTPGDAAP